MVKTLKRRKALRKAAAIIAAAACAGAVSTHAVMTFAAETVEAAEASVTFTFSENGVTASAESTGYEISGNVLNITANGVYKVTGSCSEGSVAVAKGLTDVTIILENASIGSSTTAPIVVKKGSDVTLQINGTNTLTDKEYVSTEDTNADFEGACIKVKSGSSLTITGSGTLNADASACKNGIKGGATATVTVNSSTLNINAANTGLASDGEVIVNGGNINITAVNDGIKSEPDTTTDTESKGIVTINGGNLNLNVTTADSSDAIWGYKEANVLGGNITITAGDDAIHSEYVTNIGTQGGSGPVIMVKSAVEGIEGAAVNLNSGSADITCTDDGINAANSDLTNYSYAVNITGGTWNVNSAAGDAIDSNGDINVSGGTVNVFAGTAMDSGGLDFDGKCNVTGGKLLAVGMSGMAQVPTTGTYVAFNNVNITSGANVEIKDSSGITVYSFTGKKTQNHVVYAGEGLTSGQTYTIYIDGTQAGSVTTNTAQGGMQGGMIPGAQGQNGRMPWDQQNQQTQIGQTSEQQTHTGQTDQQVQTGQQNMTPPGQNGQMPPGQPPQMNGQTPPDMNGQTPSDMQNQQDDTAAGTQEQTENTDMAGNTAEKNGFVYENGTWNYYKNGQLYKQEDIVQGTVNGESGWWYIKDGKVDLTKTSIEQNSNGWWYVKNGKVDFTKTSIEQNTNGWWYVKNGKVDFTKTSVEHNANGWWYVKNGKVDFEYNGFAQNVNGWWYIENGKVTFNKNDVILGTVNGEAAWWNVKGSKVLFNESIENNSNGWWYIKDGKVDFTKTSVDHNANGWWYVKNGKVDFTKNSIEPNKNGWWYIKNGKVDFSYNGFAQNYNGWWYVENGKVTFKKNGYIYGNINGKTANWKIVNSKVVM